MKVKNLPFIFKLSRLGIFLPGHSGKTFLKMFSVGTILKSYLKKRKLLPSFLVETNCKHTTSFLGITGLHVFICFTLI